MKKEITKFDFYLAF